MKDYIIRKALPNAQDSAGIHHVEQISLGDSPYGVERVLSVLADPTHYTWLAQSVEGTIVGFCDCFLTRRPRLCLEIDLLGVLSEARKNGLATQMLCEAAAYGHQLGVANCRALVAQDNIASWRAFEKAGFTASSELYRLLICETGSTQPQEQPHLITSPTQPAGSPSAVPLRRLQLPSSDAWVDVVKVRTIPYDGLWIEGIGEASEDDILTTLRQLVAYAQQQNLDEVGRIHPLDDESGQATALFRAGFSHIGEYYILSA